MLAGHNPLKYLSSLINRSSTLPIPLFLQVQAPNVLIKHLSFAYRTVKAPDLHQFLLKSSKSYRFYLRFAREVNRAVKLTFFGKNDLLRDWRKAQRSCNADVGAEIVLVNLLPGEYLSPSHQCSCPCEGANNATSGCEACQGSGGETPLHLRPWITLHRTMHAQRLTQRTSVDYRIGIDELWCI